MLITTCRVRAWQARPRCVVLEGAVESGMTGQGRLPIMALHGAGVHVAV